MTKNIKTTKFINKDKGCSLVLIFMLTTAEDGTFKTFPDYFPSVLCYVIVIVKYNKQKYKNIKNIKNFLIN